MDGNEVSVDGSAAMPSFLGTFLPQTTVGHSTASDKVTAVSFRSPARTVSPEKHLS